MIHARQGQMETELCYFYTDTQYPLLVRRRYYKN
jgi:hypothetical protein